MTVNHTALLNSVVPDLNFFVAINNNSCSSVFKHHGYYISKILVGSSAYQREPGSSIDILMTYSVIRIRSGLCNDCLNVLRCKLFLKFIKFSFRSLENVLKNVLEFHNKFYWMFVT